MPYFNRKKKRWIACVTKNGIRKQAIYAIKKEAQEYEAKWRKSPQSKWQEETSTVCLIDWVTRYLQLAEAKFTHDTFKEKRSIFKRFFLFIDPAIAVNNLHCGQVISYFENQYKLRGGNASNCDRKDLLAAWNWGIKYMGLPQPNPFLTEKFPEKRVTRYVPPERDFWRVFDTADEEEKVLLLTYLHTAARRNEIFFLRWDDVYFDAGEISLFTRKTKDGSMEESRLPMTEELYSIFLQRKQDAQTEWVFPNPKTGLPFTDRKKWIKSLCEKAGVRPFGFHAIRHLTASILAQNNIPMVQIQAILRHKKLSTTEIYLHRISDLRPVLKLLSIKKVLPIGASREAEAKQGISLIG